MTTINGLTGAINFTGLASGIDTSAIIDALTKFNNQRIQDLQIQKNSVLQKQTTFSDLRSKLLDLQTQAGKLARSLAGAFDARTVVSSAPDLLTGAASSTAAPGTYALTVQSLAQAQQVASQGFADPGTNIKQGTLQLKVGSGSTTTITIDSTNNTLQGLADAINTANGDVRASIVNDGSASPYRLLLTSTNTGAANTIQVTNNLTTGTGSDINPATTTVQAASDARVTIGSGAGAVSISSATNRIDNAIAGITLNVQQADPTKTITLKVSNDTTSAGDAVQAFVDSYNAAVDYIDQRDDYNQQKQQAGVLLGNRDAGDLRRDLQLVLTESVPLVNPKLSRLSGIGITFTDQGKLQFDRSRLEDIYNGKVAGVGADDVKRLFAVTGSSTNSGVRFYLASSATVPTSTPFQVDVTQAATRASIAGTNALVGSVVIDSNNNSFTIRLDNKTSTLISIPPGTYTPAQLAAAVQAAINANSQLAGSQVLVDLDAARLRITSAIFGGNSQVAIGTGTAITSGVLGFVGTESATGQNVAGTFRVNGVTETATGVGQILSGNSGNAHTDGLQVKVTLAPNQIVAGSEADVTVTRGLAERLNQVVMRYVDPVKGRFKTVDKQFQSQITDIDKTMTRQNNLLQLKKDALLKQFAAMESSINRLNVLSQQLTAQFVTPTVNSRKTA